MIKSKYTVDGKQNGVVLTDRMVLTESASLHYPVLFLFEVDTHFTPCICCWMPFTYDWNRSVDRWSGWARVGEANSRYLFQSEILSLIRRSVLRELRRLDMIFPSISVFPRKEWRNWLKPRCYRHVLPETSIAVQTSSLEIRPNLESSQTKIQNHFNQSERSIRSTDPEVSHEKCDTKT